MLPGQAASFSRPESGTQVFLEKPDGVVVPLEGQDGRLLIPEPDQLGVYHVRWGEGEAASYAVNLFSPQESNIEPAGQLAVSGLGPNGTGENTQQAQREWWRPLAWLALLLIVLEWLVYQRANVRRLWDRLTRQKTPEPNNQLRPNRRTPYR